MYRVLRGESLRHVLPRLIVCLVLAIVLLGISCPGLIRLLVGPVELDSVPVSELSGKYVTFDASQVVVAFATLSANRGDGSTEVLETHYLLPVGDGQYMAVMDQKQHNSNVLERAMDQSHEYYLGDLTTLTKLGPISGTVKALDESMTSYMTDCIDNYQLPGYEEGRDSARLLAMYQVNLGKIGFLSRNMILILAGIGGFFLLLFLIQLLTVLTGLYQKPVRALLGDTPDEEDFANATHLERVRIGKHIWYTKGAGSRAVPTDRIIWGYAMPEPMVVSKYRWPVALYDMDQKMIQINFMDQKHCQALLDVIADQGNPFISGYSSQLAEQFQNDFQGFQRQAAKAARERKGQ